MASGDRSLEQRLDALEKSVERLDRRLDALEAAVSGAASRPTFSAGARAAPPPEAPAPPPGAPPAEAPASPRRRPEAPAVSLEDLLGGRVLAWIGGVAILLGVVFFLVMAVRRGWIDEPTRVVLAFLASTALLGVGLWLHERAGRTEAALAAVASAIAGLYASLTAATQLYHLVAPVPGLGIAALVGAVATAVAVRWSSAVVAGIGIVGALVSPVLVDAPTSAVTLAFMGLALAAAVAVLLWQRWNWLALAAFVVSLPQLVMWVENTYERALLTTLAVLVLFWLLYVVAAIGYELRVRTEGLRVSSALLLFGNAVALVSTGYLVLDDRGYTNGATG